MTASVVALVVAAVAPSLAVFAVASVLIGLTTVAASVLVQVTAHLAPPERSGQAVGQVMSGLLVGILLARSAASLLAGSTGWRPVYAGSAAVLLVTALVLWRSMPRRVPEHDSSYLQLLASVGELLSTEPVLRSRSLAQALLFATFSAYWTAITYELIDEHHLGQRGIALFALVAAAGAVAAPVAGRLGDAGHGRAGRGAAMLAATMAMLLALVCHRSVIALAASGLLLDFAVQGCFILAQRDIFALRPAARARLAAIFLTTMFIGGALGSLGVGWLYGAFGWAGASAFGAAVPLVALAAFWLPERRRRVAAAQPAPSAAGSECAQMSDCDR